MEVFSADRIYWAYECVERVAGDIDERKLNEQDYYIKRDVDIYIADLKQCHIKNLQALEKYWVDNCESHERRAVLYAADHFRKIINCQKYKRCLAMARWCESAALWCYQAACTLPSGFQATLHGKPVMVEPSRLFKRSALLTKWSTRWQKLANKFNETK